MSYVNRLNLINEDSNISYVNKNTPDYYYKNGDSDEEMPNNDNMLFNLTGKSTSSTDLAMNVNLPTNATSGINTDHNPQEWKEYVSSAGYVYYYNKSKNITQWEKPEGIM